MSRVSGEGELAEAVPVESGRAALMQARVAQATVRAKVLGAEDELATVRHTLQRLAAGLPESELVSCPPAEAEPIAVSCVPMPASRPRVRPRSWAAGIIAGVLALTGTVAALGGAGAFAHLVGPSGAPASSAALTAELPAAEPGPVPPDDPGKSIYAARFAKVSAAEKTCLARAIYFEARGESFEGQVAVAQVVLNRARSQKWPGTLCRVVYQGIERGEKCQFSFACMRHAEPSGDLWDEAQAIAEQAVTGHAWLREAVEATYYHATNVAPVWRLSLVATGTIGSHIFYRDRKGLQEAAVAKFAPAVAVLRPAVRRTMATAALAHPAAVPHPAAAPQPAAVPEAAAKPAAEPSVAHLPRNAEPKVQAPKVREAKAQPNTEANVAAQRRKAADADSNWSANLLQPKF